MSEDFDTKEQLREAEELTNNLISRAKKGKHSKFDFIRSLEERYGVRQYYKASIEVANQFYKMWKASMKAYTKEVLEGRNSLDVILTAKNCNEIAEFYYKEAEIADDMCKEYWSYVTGGHFIDTLVGVYRAEEDLVDYRTLPTKWF